MTSFLGTHCTLSPRGSFCIGIPLDVRHRLRKGRFTLGGNFRAECRFRDDVVTISLRMAYIERKLQ